MYMSAYTCTYAGVISLCAYMYALYTHIQLHTHTHTVHRGFRKDAMMNYAKALDLTQTYQDSFQKLYDSLRCVEQEQEYVEFIRENKK